MSGNFACRGGGGWRGTFAPAVVTEGALAHARRFENGFSPICVAASGAQRGKIVGLNS